MPSCKVHNVRFYNLLPTAIHCMAYEPYYMKLALSRSDHRIEIWDFREVPHMECLLPNLRNNSVESLAWCNERLFSTGLEGFVVEYSIPTLSIKNQLSVTAGPAWCLAVNKSKTVIAVGTEDGYVNLFRILETEIVYEKVMDKQEGRILCIGWESSGRMIVTGSSDAIRIWNVETGHAIHRMTIPREVRSKETVIWCLSVTSDFTIITGDSRGELSIWSGHQGILQQSFKTHSADILSLCVTEEEDTIYCAGVDPVICSIAIVQTKVNEFKWARSVQRRIRSHDVRALVIAGKRLISGGVDGYLAVSSPPKIVTKYPPLLQHPAVMISKETRYLLLRYYTYLEVWHLGEVMGEPTSTKLLSLESAGKDPITCAAISQNGKWLAYSTPIKTRLFIFEYHEDAREPLLQKAGLPKEVGPSQHIMFTPDKNRAVLATYSRELLVMKLENGDATILHSFHLFEGKFLKNRVFLMDISPDGKYLVAADHQSNIVVWTLEDGKLCCRLPRHGWAPTALRIQPKSNIVVVAYSNHSVMEYSIPQNSYTDFSRRLNKKSPKHWLNRSFPVQGIAFDPRNLDVIILYDDSTLLIINKTKELPDYDAKIPRLDSSHSDSMDSYPSNPRVQEPQHALHVIKKYKHLVHLDWLEGDEMVAVEISPAALAETLPPVLKKKRFGV